MKDDKSQTILLLPKSEGKKILGVDIHVRPSESNWSNEQLFSIGVGEDVGSAV